MTETSTNNLDTPIEYLKGVGPQRADILKKDLSIFTIGDLLQHYPFRYVDKTKIYSISEITPATQFIQLKGVVTNIQTKGKRYKKILTALLKDDTGTVELIWFKGVNWLLKYIQPNSTYIVYGKPGYFKNKFNIPHPELEIAAMQHKNKPLGLQPVYGTTEKLKSKYLDSRGIKNLMKAVFTMISPGKIKENLPKAILTGRGLVDRYQAMLHIHFPVDEQVMERAIRRLKFEELFLIQVRLLKSKSNRNENIKGYVFPELGDHFNTFYKKKLNFELTGAQKRVIKEIRQDVLSGKQMNRLLEGDVGSGKTVVALFCMLMAIDNNFQACIMAPTEILAQQHYQSISAMVNDIGLNTGLLTGSVKSKERKELLKKLVNGEIHILIGTHALIEDWVKFDNLGMVIIDEQHRFGVAQRAKLWSKSKQLPHVLVMTATPIPRTLAMTLYGDLDISVIDEMPPGRKPIITVHRKDENRLRVFGFMREHIGKGNQVYVVYPLIEESETMDYKDLMDGYESVVREFPLPEYKVSILHGKMKPEDKEYEMGRFVKGETNIMVATNVIEVGVDVPSVTVMVIESAERFGLSQLHQLRGRVGRGPDQAYCILMTGDKLSNDARLRIKTMTSTTNGFEIADADLRLRGPGELEGTIQSGITNLKLVNLGEDGKILQEAREEAMTLIDEDPKLAKQENLALKKYFDNKYKGKITWGRVS